MKRRGSSRFRVFTTCLTLFIAIASAGTSFEANLYAQAPQSPVGLTIIVIKGEDSVNIIKKKTAVKPVVEVRDRNNLPVAGASVVFLTPSSGASATFAKGANTVTLVTNSAGRASVSSLQPVEPGAFRINVTASFNGEMATTSIGQTNFLTTEAAKAAGALGGGGTAAGGGMSAATVGIIVAGAAAAATVVAVTLKDDTPKATIEVRGTPGLSNPFIPSRIRIR